MPSTARLTLATAVAAVGGVGGLIRHRQSLRNSRQRSAAQEPAPPPLTTQSSPGQIADLQQAYGDDMAAPSAPPSDGGTAVG